MTAVLTESETAVGRPVQMEIQITGASNPKPPSQINVDGLEIQSAGMSRQYQVQNFSVSYNFTYTYTIMPLKAGTFKIPPQSVDAGGQTLQTPALTLNVVDSPGQSARSRRGNSSSGGNIDPAQIGFVEMLLPKSVAYVGEMVPVQIRVGISMRAPLEGLGGGIEIAGQGFTRQKMPEPRQTIENINGRSYQVFIFKTALAPVRAGKLEVGPAEIKPVVRVPRPGARNPVIPRSLFDDPFFNNLFDDPALAPSMPKEITLKSQPATLEVKPLPPNAPPGFSGAVGSFTMKADVNPKTAKVGDPLTATISITGRGNFDRLTAPTLEDENGWHKYPSSDKFTQDDDVGISGMKAFETVLSAKERKDKLPSFEFTYFDPVKENYTTLRSDPISLRLEGGALATPTPAIAAVPVPSAPALAPTPAVEKRPEGILSQLDDRPLVAESFTPLYEQRAFWLAQLLPLLALLGLIGWKWRQARRGDREAQRAARLHHELAELQRRLRRHDVAPQDYMTDAARAVKLKAALAKHLDPRSVDADAAASAFRLDETERARLRNLFEQSDELRYSGATNGHTQISPQRREEILELVENLRA